MNAARNLIDNVRNGLVLCNIGQFTKSEQGKLDRAVKRGDIFKTRAPFAGRYGAMKTYYAASESAFLREQNANIAKFDLAAAIDNHNRRDPGYCI